MIHIVPNLKLALLAEKVLRKKPHKMGWQSSIFSPLFKVFIDSF